MLITAINILSVEKQKDIKATTIGNKKGANTTDIVLDVSTILALNVVGIIPF